MQYNDEEFAQSGAIARFLAKKFGMFGRNETEEGDLNMIVGYFDDCLESKMT